MQQPNLALHAIQESLPPAKHKRSTDEIFSEPQRLHKVLASCGFGSRRAMEDMIIAGRITVNRLPAEVGQKVGPGDEVRINGELVKVRFSEPRPRILMYHKPAGEIVTRDDPEGRPTVFEKLPNIGNGKWINVGRLDYNTEGLMLFTNSGELANRLMHPRYEVEREYAVRIMGRLTDEQMLALTTGIELDDGPAKCEKLEDGGGEDEGANHWYHVVLKEGRNREVRRLFEALGLTVSRLIRTRYGTLAMPSVMKRADTLELEPAEVSAVMESAGLKSQGGAPGQPRPGGGKPNPRQPGQPGQRPHGKHGGRSRGKGGPGPEGQGGQGIGRGSGQGQGGFGQGGFDQGQGGGQRPQRQHTDFDNQQPHSNANASPFATNRLGVPGGPRGGQRGGPPGQGGFANRGNRSGPRGRPGGGQGNGQFRAKGHNQGGGQGGAHGAGNGPRRNGPRGEADGNVAPREVDANQAPREEANGNIAPRNSVVPHDDDD